MALRAADTDSLGWTRSGRGGQDEQVMLKTKSVWTPIDRKRDGLRLLVTRFRGRGMPASRYDVWMPSLGPSERLLREFLGGKISWPAFGRSYRKELFLDGPIDRKSRSIKNHGQKFTLRSSGSWRAGAT